MLVSPSITDPAVRRRIELQSALMLQAVLIHKQGCGLPPAVLMLTEGDLPIVTEARNALEQACNSTNTVWDVISTLREYPSTSAFLNR